MGKRGILLAVSSLPGKYGVGDFSDESLEFIRILKKNKIDVWQIFMFLMRFIFLLKT